MEKKVILEEIAKYEDQPPFGAHEKCMAAALRRASAGPQRAGHGGQRRGPGRDQMLEYFRQRYSPRNIVLVGRRPVDFERLVRLADRHCGRWEPFDALRDTARAADHRGLAVVHKDNAPRSSTSCKSPTGRASEDDARYAARLLATILGDSSGSRMYWELFDPGLAECAVMEACDYQGAGIFLSYLSCAPEDTADNLALIDEICREAQAAGVTPQELKQAKSKICSHVVLQSERPGNRLFSVGSNWLQRREYRTVREIARPLPRRHLRRHRGGAGEVPADQLHHRRRRAARRNWTSPETVGPACRAGPAPPGPGPRPRR